MPHPTTIIILIAITTNDSCLLSSTHHASALSIPAAFNSLRFYKSKSPTRHVTLLNAFPRRVGDDYYDEEDDGEDDEPPELSISPQEFLLKVQQNKRGDEGEDDIPSFIPSIGPTKRRPTQQVRPAGGAFSPKKTSSKETSTVYICTNCNAEYLQWKGRCGTCQEWNTIQEFRATKKSSFGSSDISAGIRPKLKRDTFQRSGSSWLDGAGIDAFGEGEGPVRLTDVYQEIMPKDGTDKSWKDAYGKGSREQRTEVPNDPEINSVLGGGLMPGSITLVGGDPGMCFISLPLAFYLAHSLNNNELQALESRHYFFRWQEALLA
jgi:hypothetical protein